MSDKSERPLLMSVIGRRPKRVDAPKKFTSQEQELIYSAIVAGRMKIVHRYESPENSRFTFPMQPPHGFIL